MAGCAAHHAPVSIAPARFSGGERNQRQATWRVIIAHTHLGANGCGYALSCSLPNVLAYQSVNKPTNPFDGALSHDPTLSDGDGHSQADCYGNCCPNSHRNAFPNGNGHTLANSDADPGGQLGGNTHQLLAKLHLHADAARAGRDAG